MWRGADRSRLGFPTVTGVMYTVEPVHHLFYSGAWGICMDGRRILVTGGAGFIGSNLANTLAPMNDVIAIDDCSLGTATNLTSGVDFRERSILETDLPTAVDVIFHMAALSSYQMHNRDPLRGVRVNVEGFVNVVEQARLDGCESIVYASTSSVYHDNQYPTAEDYPLVATTGYEASKLARERYAEYFNHQSSISLSGMRLFSVYEGFGGTEAHKGQFANLVSQFADVIAAGDSPVIYGDGTQTRDFIHIEDVVTAIIAAANADLEGIYNVGTGTSHSLNELVDLLTTTFDVAIDPEYIQNPVADAAYVQHTCGDSTKLQSATGWQPTIDLAEGVQRVYMQYQ